LVCGPKSGMVWEVLSQPARSANRGVTYAVPY
jgi:hypothetical protein